MAKKGFNVDEKWLREKGYTPNRDGSWSPLPIKSPFIREKKGLPPISNLPKQTIEEFEAFWNKPIILNSQTELNSCAKPLAVFNINPIGKPRMTQRDKWDKRKNVQLYWKYKATLLSEAKKQNFTMPDNGYHIICYIQMPHSWPEKKKAQMDMSPHQQKPDKDNIEKGILDALLKEDSCVWDGRITKYWGRSGKIVIYNV